ncbi:hypothetical protein [Corynebacterium nasicanis]|uniref:Secreted protein n=1 Tax=Corynebacterium nasicanis TaxID=1448267 RepID=A0ABW1Q779_9CORY
MTRSERKHLLAIVAAIVLILGGIVAAVVFGVKDAEPEVVAEQAAVAAAEPAEAPEPLDNVKVNRIYQGEVPEVGETFRTGSRSFEYMRSWEGEVEVWRGYAPQIILGPGENWFPAGQPGCGEGRYVVSFAASGPISASLIDEEGEITAEQDSRTGWMLLDDCQLPHVALPTGAESSSDTVVFEAHEFQPAS